MPYMSLAAAGLVLLQSSAIDVSIDEDVRLEACIDRMETDPSGAYEDGLALAVSGQSPEGSPVHRPRARRHGPGR